MGKTFKDEKNPNKKVGWKRINTARSVEESHTADMEFKASDRSYIVTADGSWRRK